MIHFVYVAGPESPFTKNPERKGERIHEQEEILSLISERVPGLPGIEELKGKITRELRDVEGIYLLELELPGSMPGQVHEYRYMRGGNHGSQNSSAESRIDVVLYEEGIPVISDQLAKFNVAAQSWNNV